MYKIIYKSKTTILNKKLENELSPILFNILIIHKFTKKKKIDKYFNSVLLILIKLMDYLLMALNL